MKKTTLMNMGVSPFERCTRYQEEGIAFYMAFHNFNDSGETQIYDIVSFGPEWVELSIVNESTPSFPFWRRWADLAFFSIEAG